jgi:hypothetical protein
MKTKLIPIIALLSIAWLYPACSKDTCEHKTEYDNILQEYKDMIPYKGGEKLTFLHVNTGDTVVFEGESNWTQYYNGYSYGAGDGVCFVTEEKLEGRRIEFFSRALNEGILINQYIIEQGNAVLRIDFKDLEIQSIDYAFKLGTIDSVIVQGKIYRDVYFMSNDLIDQKPYDFGCLYNHKNGIIRMFFKTGETWELLSKN